MLDGGSDWQTVRTDGATTLDEALISMTYRGIRYGPPDVMARIDKGEVRADGPIYSIFEIL